MRGIRASTDAYEAWLEQRLGDAFVRKDLERKHRKMRTDAFTFLRATYWRFAETVGTTCPELARAPQLLAVGDVHLENFGTWRDAEGRLVWGVNDFDEAAIMPYALDLVRLAASALLARGADGPPAGEICDALLDGYWEGLTRPRPVILERGHGWLRDAVLLPETERADFWETIDAACGTPVPAFRAALVAALPHGAEPRRFGPRVAGTGSLGRARFVVKARWRGGPVVREAKALVPSAWSYARGESGLPLRVAEIAAGHHRAPDPHYAVAGDIVVRRLSPNSRKLEVGAHAPHLLSARMLRLMGFDVANCHAGTVSALGRVRADLDGRAPGWLKVAAKAAAAQVRDDLDAYDR